ncbi:MAG: hypothetical protein NC453_19605 [Muribaculum sp.]|nr:hypothetical protein [Muribaculum sp.]
MNKERREELLDVVQSLDEAIDRLEEIRDDEQDAFDSMPEGLQYSSRGDAMQEAIDTLDGFGDEIAKICAKIGEYAQPKKKKKT